MPHLATVLGGPLSSDFVIPEVLEPPLTLARIFIVAAQNVKIWLSGTSSVFCPNPIRSAARRAFSLTSPSLGVTPLFPAASAIRRDG